MGRLWERFKRWFFQRYKFTRQSIFWTLFCIVVFALTLYFMNVMANVASYLSPDNTKVPKLSDRLFEATPSIQLLWLTDLADALLFVPTVILVLTHYRPLYLLCKVLLTWALCNLMRITTVAITSFPDPRDVDVLVAFYVAGGNFYIWTYIFDHYTEEKGRLEDLTHPWGDGPDPRPHAQEREQKRQLRVSTDAEKAAMAEHQPASVYQTGEAQMQPVYTETGQPSNSQVYYTNSGQPASNQTTYNNQQGDDQGRIQIVKEQSYQEQPYQEQPYQEQPYQEQPYQEQPMQLPGEVYTHPERQ
ncbi:hypothetical protein BGX30_006205 [Mortierella sp. GBA39]|nr:hypothetical protein BGX30_006205 [Mortierella sp. GBA39]